MNKNWKYEAKKMILSITSFKKVYSSKKVMFITTPTKLDNFTLAFLNRIKYNIILLNETNTTCDYNVNVL